MLLLIIVVLLLLLPLIINIAGWVLVIGVIDASNIGRKSHRGQQQDNRLSQPSWLIFARSILQANAQLHV